MIKPIQTFLSDFSVPNGPWVQLHPVDVVVVSAESILEASSEENAEKSLAAENMKLVVQVGTYAACSLAQSHALTYRIDGGALPDHCGPLFYLHFR